MNVNLNEQFNQYITTIPEKKEGNSLLPDLKEKRREKEK